MIGIEAIASYVPSGRESNYDKKEQFDIDDAFIVGKIGVEAKAVRGKDEESSDMCVEAFRALVKKTNVSAEEVDCIVVCTQNPDGSGLPHTSAVVHGKIGGKEDCAAFDIGLGCSGFVYSLSVVSAFMTTHGMSRGLLFTADPYSKIVDPNDKNTSLLFGDAAAVTLLSDRPAYFIDEIEFGTKGKDSEVLRCVDGSLQMNGRAVFGFSMLSVPPQLRSVVSKAGLEMDEIDVFAFHQGSKYIVDNLTTRLGLDPAKVPSNIANIGNTISSSIPLVLEAVVDKKEVGIVAICGFGVGLSWASAVMRKA